MPKPKDLTNESEGKSIPTCVICGHQGFKTWTEYKNHHERHNIRSTSEGLVIDAVEPARQYSGPMDAAKKWQLVESVESKIRTDAWLEGRLNPLVGTDVNSSEPVWDKERNIL